MRKPLNTLIVLLLTLMSTYTVQAFSADKANLNYENLSHTNEFNTLTTLNTSNFTRHESESIDNNYCSIVSVTGGTSSITIGGITAPWHKIQYKLDGASVYSDVCNDNCGNPHVINGLTKGKYVIRVEQSSGGGVDHCVVEIAANVTGTSIDYCQYVQVVGGVGSITIRSVNAPWHKIQYKLDGTSTYSDICNDNCTNPHTIYGLAKGQYIIRVEQSSGNGSDHCVTAIAAIVTGPSIDYCKNVQVVGSVGKITIKGVNAPWNKIQYRLDGGSTYYDVCNDNCYNPQTISGLAPGKYVVRAEQSSGSGTNHCVVEIAAIVTSTSIDYCKNVQVVGGVGKITVKGVNAPWNKIQYRLDGGSTYYDVCNDNCSDPQTISGLAPGKYVVRAAQSSGGGTNHCVVEIAAIVTSTTAIDYCKDVVVDGGVGTISVSGINGPWNRVQYRSRDHHVYYDLCNDNCGYAQTFSGIPVGSYLVRIEQSSGGNYNFCSVELPVEVISSSSFSYCDDVVITASASKIIIKGVNAPWNRIQIKGPSTNHQPYTICDDTCYDPSYTHIEVSNLKAGHYTVTTEESNGQYSYCKVNRTVYISAHLTNDDAEDSRVNATANAILAEEFALELGLAEGLQPNANIFNLSEGNENLNTALKITTTVEAIQMYPNPATNEIFVNLAPFAGQSATIMIVNQIGALVKELTIRELTENPLQFEVSNLDNGLYFMQASIGGNQSVTKKFMVSKN